MHYKAELEYLIKVLQKMRLQAFVSDCGEPADRLVDLGLRSFLGIKTDYRKKLPEIKGNTIYTLRDEFMCNYIFLRLPEMPGEAVLMIGPYLSSEMTRERLLEEAERLGVSALQFPQMERYYANIPILTDMRVLMNLIDVFGETLWGVGNAFKIVDFSWDQSHPVLAAPPDDAAESKNIIMQMKMMETRYAYENALMERVSRGLTYRAKLMISNVSGLTFERRAAEPIRNVQNYCIICNTLMRKAAERGGVHPIYLDRTSSEYAEKIELLTNAAGGETLMDEMIHAYCHLVRKYALKQYSPLVQRAVAHIESELAGDLSLRAMAAIQNVNASYLSSVFRKEMGQTITEYVNRTRMTAAARMLRTTRLQIQTVAQYCGMSDANYFSKMFKKHYGMTPRQYREEERSFD